jgi:hypothetical protein
MFPLRGLWNHAPEEGDYLITCEVDWLVSPPGNAVQFSVQGNSPVALSQIVALAVDNSKSGADVQFIFTDSGFKLTVPAHNQVVAPVFTNGLSFIANAPGAIVGDQTVFQILNSAAMPVSIAPSVLQNVGSVVGITTANGSTPIVSSTISGSLNTASISFNFGGVAAAGQMQILLEDGTGKILWTGEISVLATPAEINPILIPNLSIRFVNGINIVVVNSNIVGGAIIANLYYTTP